jgi:hypothetical protein
VDVGVLLVTYAAFNIIGLLRRTNDRSDKRADDDDGGAFFALLFRIICSVPGHGRRVQQGIAKSRDDGPVFGSWTRGHNIAKPETKYLKKSRPA